MSIYGFPFYADGTYYGSDEFNNPSGGLANLNAYQNNLDTVVLYWTLHPCTSAIHNFVWTVQTDTVNTFDSPDLRVYVTGTGFGASDSLISLDGELVAGNTISVDVDGFTVSVPYAVSNLATMTALAAAISARPNVASATINDTVNLAILVRSTVITTPVVLTGLFIAGGASQAVGTIGVGAPVIYGQINKGVVVRPYDRNQGTARPMHWRAKGILGNAETLYVTSVFKEIPAINGVSRDNILNLISDIIYKKTPDSNIYKLHDDFGKNLDDLWVNDAFVNNDTYLELVRDISLQTHFGDLVGILRPPPMKAIDFREILKEFFVAARNSPLVIAIRNMVRACLCADPVIDNIRDTLDLYVSDSNPVSIVDPPYVSDPPSSVLPPTVWDNQHLAFGVIVNVTNPTGALVSREFLQFILRKLVQSHAPLYVQGIP